MTQIQSLTTLAPGCATIVLRGPAEPVRGVVHWPRLPLPPAGPRPVAVVVSPSTGDRLVPPERLARPLVADAQLMVLALTVPEPRAAADVEAVWTALLWVADHAREIDGDPDRLLLIGQAGAADVARTLAGRAHEAGWPPLWRLVLLPSTPESRDLPPSGPGPPALAELTTPAEPVQPYERRHLS
ncbi:alpha/beta hydrolase [Jiangella asiatica]|nr:alpha/beta hydrolase fold domain-containing protein [Jiangella asiatica]